MKKCYCIGVVVAVVVSVVSTAGWKTDDYDYDDDDDDVAVVVHLVYTT